MNALFFSLSLLASLALAALTGRAAAKHPGFRLAFCSPRLKADIGCPFFRVNGRDFHQSPPFWPVLPANRSGRRPLALSRDAVQAAFLKLPGVPPVIRLNNCVKCDTSA
jgi:hypothetical protein